MSATATSAPPSGSTRPAATDGLALGGSIAVNGVCLTATEIDGKDFSVDVMGETLTRSTIGELAAGDPVNLERCVPAGGRLDGHVVQGHVDGVGQLLEREAWATGTGSGSAFPPDWPATSLKRDPSRSTAFP